MEFEELPRILDHPAGSRPRRWSYRSVNNLPIDAISLPLAP
jgi:hypothetical protein